MTVLERRHQCADALRGEQPPGILEHDPVDVGFLDELRCLRHEQLVRMDGTLTE